MEIDNGINVAIDVSGAAEETRERERVVLFCYIATLLFNGGYYL